MIVLTSDEDKIQLKEHALELLNKNNFEGLVILVETLNDTDFESELRNTNFGTDIKNYYLDQAARLGHLEIVKYLIGSGANAHLKGNEVLRWAIHKNHWEIAKYFVEQGANFKAALDFAQIFIDEEMRLLKMIPITSEQDRDYLRQYGFDLLKQREFQGLVVFIEVLNEIDFESNLKDINFNLETKNYYLKQAAKFGRLEIIKYLVESGADIHATNNEALRWAVFLGHREIVKYLIDSGANIHIDDNYVLRWATENEYLDVVKCAIEHGADIHADNDSVLKSAKSSGNIEIIEYLEEVLRNDHTHK